MSAFTSWFFRNTTIPIWQLREGGHQVPGVARRFRTLNQLSAQQIRSRQQNHLAAMLQHASLTVPYYRERFADLRLDITAMSRALDLGQLPPLTKKDIRQNTAALVSQAVGEDARLKDSTGGSTGMPMVFYRSEHCLTLRRAQDIFFDEWFGFRPGDRIALFVSASHHQGGANGLKSWLRQKTFERMIRFDPAHTSDQEIAAYLPSYLSFQPEVIKCFPNSLTIFSDYLERMRIKVPTVRTVFCTGESLYAHQREDFARRFGARVVERYGTKECGLIASECSSGQGMHIFSEGAFVEVVDEHGNPVKPGESGRILVTDLFNDAMPLIRYEIGDRALTLSGDAPCPCGSGLPRIARILGRDRDILIDSDGVKRPGYLFVECIAKADIEAQMQVVQTETGDVEIRVAGYHGSPEPLDVVRSSVASIMGPRRNVRLLRVDAVQRDPSGKFPYVISQFKPKDAS